MMIKSRLIPKRVSYLLSFLFCFIGEINSGENEILKKKEASMELKQQTIGIIGGVSWESTVFYYKLINELIREQLGGLNSAKILMYSLNYENIVQLELDNKWDEVGTQLGIAARSLQDGGADFIILCCNTLHKVAPQIESAISIPFLHIADPIGSVLVNHQMRRVGLLGTQFTMEEGFYSSHLEDKFGLEIIVPDLNSRKILDHIIYQELCQGKVLSQSKDQIIQIIQSLQKEGIEAVILGCTELGMLIKSDDLPIPVYDTTVLHAKEAVNKSLYYTQTTSKLGFSAAPKH